MKKKMKKTLSIILALVMGLSTISVPAVAGENEIEISTEAYEETEPATEEAIQESELPQEQTDSGQDETHQAETEAILQKESSEFGQNEPADDFESVQSDMPQESLTDASEEGETAVMRSSTDIRLEEKESDNEGFLDVGIKAFADNDTDTECRLYFWQYDGSLPDEADEWETYFTDPFDGIKIMDLNEEFFDMDLDVTLLDGSRSAVDAKLNYKKEQRESNENDELTAVYLDFTLPAGSSMNEDLFIGYKAMTASDAYLMIEGCYVEGEQENTTDYLPVVFEYNLENDDNFQDDTEDIDLMYEDDDEFEFMTETETEEETEIEIQTLAAGDTAFAVYCADDGSLTFYTDAEAPESGETYNEKAVTTVYTGIESTSTSSSSVPWYADRTSFKSVAFDESFVSVQPAMTAYWFYGMTNCTEIAGLEHLDTSKATNMRYMFYNCNKLTELDVNGFDTSNVTNMSDMFDGCSGLNSIDVSGFNTAKVTDMSYMFYGCSSLVYPDVSRFDTSSVTDMSGMFGSCSKLRSLDVSGFDTKKVESFSRMFYKCSLLIRLDVSGFNTSEAFSMNSMFYSCSTLTSLDVSGFDTSNVEDMDGMFTLCEELTELNISSFDTSNLYDANDMFSSCRNLKTIYSDDNIFDVTTVETDNMFTNDYSLVGGNGTIYDEQMTGGEMAHVDVEGNPGYFTQNTYSWTLSKKDDSGNLLSGATFNLFDSNGNLLYFVQNGEYYTYTNNNTGNASTDLIAGNVVINGLPEGTYTLTELEAPEGYEKSDASTEIVLGKNDSSGSETTAGSFGFYLEAQGSTGVTLEGDAENGVFNNRQPDGIKIDGFQFAIQNENGEFLCFTYDPNSNTYAANGETEASYDSDKTRITAGSTFVTGLQPGNYLIYEIENIYELSYTILKEPIELTIHEDGTFTSSYTYNNSYHNDIPNPMWSDGSTLIIMHTTGSVMNNYWKTGTVFQVHGYCIEESSVVNTKILDDDTFEVWIYKYGDNGSYITDEYSVNWDTPLSGAEFIISRENSSGQYEYAVADSYYDEYDDICYTITEWSEDKNDATTFITAVDGWLCIVNMESGTYILTETKAPDGYVQLTEDIVFLVDNQGIISIESGAAEATIDGNICIGNSLDFNIDINKTDADGNPLRGAEFVLGFAWAQEQFAVYLDGGYEYYYGIFDYADDSYIFSQNEFVETREDATKLVTDANGNIHLSNLQYSGMNYYFLIETKAPEGYDLIEEPIIFWMFNDGTIELTSENSNVSVSSDGKTMTVVDDTIPTYGFGINKVDEDGNPLEGAEFELCDSDWNTLYFMSEGDTYTLCDEDDDGAEYIINAGYAWIEGLDAGEYRLFEDSAPEGYLLNYDIIYITITEDANDASEWTVSVESGEENFADASGHDVTIRNQKQTADIVFNKYFENEDGFYMSGLDPYDEYVFTVTLENQDTGKTYEVEVSTWGGGYIEGLPCGTYIVRESECDGFDFVRMEVSNVPSTAATMAPGYGNVYFDVYETDGDGNPLSYILTIEYDDSGYNTGCYIDIYNELSDVGFGMDVQKTDSEGNPLAGAEFIMGSYAEISDDGGTTIKLIDETSGISYEYVYLLFDYDSEGNSYRLNLSDFAYTRSDATALTTDAEGRISLKGLISTKLAGSPYFLVETKAPEGYDLIEEPITFTMEDDGTIVLTSESSNVSVSSDGKTVTVVDDASGTDISVKKTDGEGKDLSGAKFILTNEDGQYYAYDEASESLSWVAEESEASVLTSEEDGLLTFHGLTDGTYMLTETEAPTGYLMLEDSITFVIEEQKVVSVSSNGVLSDDALMITVENIKAQGLLNTGGSGTMPLIITGLAFMLLALVMRRRMRTA